MIFSLFLDWCGNSSCIHCELDLYMHLSNDRDSGLFYLLSWMVWCRLSSWRHCCIPSIVLGSAVSYVFYWLYVVYRWLLRLRPSSKTFQRHHPLIHLGCFKVLPITAFHVDAVSTWYMMLVLGGEAFWWWWLTRVLFT